MMSAWCDQQDAHWASFQCIVVLWCRDVEIEYDDDGGLRLHVKARYRDSDALSVAEEPPTDAPSACSEPLRHNLSLAIYFQ